MKRVAVLACLSLVAGTATAVSTAATAATTAAVPPDVIDVVSVTGSGGAPAPVSVVPLLASATTSTAGTPIALPTTASGTTNPLTLGATTGSEGQLGLSADGRYLTLAGYSAPPNPGGASANSTTAAAVPRVVGRIDAAGTVDTSTLLGSDAFSANNVRSATTDDGSRFWVTGANTKTGGVVAYATLGSTANATPLSTAATNGRSVHVAGGSLYVDSDKTTPIGTYRVGSGLPTTTGQTLTPLTGTAAPNDFALLTLGGGTSPDTEYVAEQAGGISKYSLVGGAWTKTGTVGTGGYFGLAARAQNGGVQLYATTADFSKVVGLFDASGAGGTLTATPATIATAPGGSYYHGVAFGPTGQPAPGPRPTLTTSDSALGAVAGDPGNPTLTVTLTDADSSVDTGSLTVKATSSNQAVAADSGITVSGSGATRTVTVTPGTSIGYATITLSATDGAGRTGTTTFTYGVSAAAADSTSHWLDGASDSSSAVDVGDGYALVADDSTNVLRLFHTDRSGPAVRQWDLNAAFGLSPTKGSDSLDLEAAARVGDTIYWTGSMGNSSTDPFPARPNRSSLFATTISGSGANTQLTVPTTRYTGLRQDLIDWDQANGNPLGLAASATGDPKTVAGFNVEGMEFAADGRTAYIGFRAPLENPTDRTKALVVPVTNLPDLTSGVATKATFGAPLLWDLGGLAVREIRRNADNQYLIIAGSSTGDSPTYRLYTWNGDPASAPVAATTVLPTPRGGWESIVATPDPIADGSAVQLIEDDGSVDFYGDGQESKDLALGLRKSRIDTVTLTLPTQQLTFTSSPPAAPAYGDTYTVSATGGPSGQPVTFTVDPAGGCTLGPVTSGTDGSGDATASATVTYGDVGPCTITAHQAGGTGYQDAAAVSQTSTAVKATPTLTWPAPAAIGYGTALGDAQLDATASVPGTVAYDPPAGTVLGAGDHTLTATFTPDDTRRYSSATASVTLTVTKASQTIAFDPIADHTYGDGPVALHATGGGSTSPVTFTTDGPCTVGSDATVTITGAGRCSVTADQAGDANYSAAPSVTRTFTVAKATPVLAWTPRSAALTYGDALGADQLDATASVPGTFAYSPGSGTVLHAGTQTLSATFTPTDTDDYASGGTVTTSVTVARAAQTLTISSTGTHRYGDAPFTVSATGGHSGSPVTFTATGPCTLGGATSSGDPVTGSVRVTVTAAGDCVLTAHQAGSADYLPAPDASTSLTVAKATPTVTWGPPASIVYGTRLAYATFFTANASVAGSFTYLVDGASYDGSAPHAGDHTLTATFYPTDYADYETVTVSRTLTVQRAPQAVTLARPKDQTYGAAPLSLAVTGGASGQPVVVVADPGSTCSTSAVTAGTVRVTLTGAGTCALTASQAGSADYLDADPVHVAFTIAKAPSTVTLAAIGIQRVGATVKLRVSTAGSAAAAVLAAAPRSVCTVTGTTLRLAGPGRCTVTATLAGDADHTAARAASATVTVTYGVRATVSPASARAGVRRTVTVTLLDAAGRDVSAASVHVRLASGTAFAYRSGRYTLGLATSGLAVGRHTLTYRVTGDPLAHAVTFTVTRR